MFVKGPPGCNPLRREDRMPIVRTISGDTCRIDARLTAIEGGPASSKNSHVEFVLSENQFSPPLWTGKWNAGIKEDENRPGLVHIEIPLSISKALRRGSYSFSVRVSDLLDSTYKTQLEGKLLVEYAPTSDQRSIPYRDGTSDIFSGGGEDASGGSAVPSDELETVKKMAQDAQRTAEAANKKAEDADSSAEKAQQTADHAADIAGTAIQGVKVNGAAITPDADKAVDVPVPQSSDNVPVIAGTANAGSLDAYSRGDHVHPAETEVVGYRLPDGCFPVTCQNAYNYSEYEFLSNDDFQFQENGDIVALYSSKYGGTVLCFFDLATLKYLGPFDVENIKFNGVSPIRNASPTLRNDAVYVRSVQVAMEADVAEKMALKANDNEVLKKSGDQILDGSLTIIRGHDFTLKFALDAMGQPYIAYNRNVIAIPQVDNGVLALVSQIYAAVQQIAPDFAAKAYVLNELCTYNGVVYRCKSAYTATAKSTKPNSDTTHWEAKKVSELFLPLTGGKMTGCLALDHALILRGASAISGYGLEITRYSGESAGGWRFYQDSNNGLSIILGGQWNYIVFRRRAECSSDTVTYLHDLAPEYSTRKTYEIGSLVVYTEVISGVDNEYYHKATLYRCTTAITTAEAWTAAHWTEATVEDVLAAIRSTLDAKAPLASPALTGTPTAPTANKGTNTTQVATTAFVQTAIGDKQDALSQTQLDNIAKVSRAILYRTDKNTAVDIGARKANTTVGAGSVVEGSGNTADGQYSHAEGQNTVASGSSSHAEGLNSVARGGALGGAHAEGFSTSANGMGAHTEGLGAVAGGNGSHAEGVYTETQNESEHAEGAFNASHKANDTWGNAGNTLSSIGCGTGDNSRKNAIEVMQDGKTFVKGLGGYDGTNPTGAGVKDLATVIESIGSSLDVIEIDDAVDAQDPAVNAIKSKYPKSSTYTLTHQNTTAENQKYTRAGFSMRLSDYLSKASAYVTPSESLYHTAYVTIDSLVMYLSTSGNPTAYLLVKERNCPTEVVKSNSFTIGGSAAQVSITFPANAKFALNQQYDFWFVDESTSSVIGNVAIYMENNYPVTDFEVITSSGGRSVTTNDCFRGHASLTVVEDYEAELSKSLESEPVKTVLADLPRAYSEWIEPLADADQAGGYNQMFITPSAFGAGADCIIRALTIKTANNIYYIPKRNVYAKLIDPDNANAPLVVSRPVYVSAAGTEYMFIFDGDAPLTYTKQYRVDFMSAAGADALPVNVAMRLSGAQSGVQDIYYGAFTAHRPIIKILYAQSEVASKAYVQAQLGDIESVLHAINYGA